MGAVQPCITPELAEFILAQPLFFVGTAPLSRTGHINLSPKGLRTFRVLSGMRVAYLDLTGSGNETAAHVLENGRITFLFCAFEEPPKILRLYGTGRTVREDEAEWPEMIGLFPELPGARQIVVADITRVQTSCGFGVPIMKVVEQRETLVKSAERRGPAGMADYREKKNLVSIDGLSAYGSREVGAVEGGDLGQTLF